MGHQIFVADDDPDFVEVIRSTLRGFGFDAVQTELDPLRAADAFTQGLSPDLALIDMTMPDMDGIALLDIIKRNSPRTECIMVTATNEARVVVECLKKGAYDYLIKPVEPEDLLLVMNRALERKRLLDVLDIEKGRTLPELVHKKAFQPIVTRCDNVLRVLKAAELHAASDEPILIFGESGTGKELLARAIHAASTRSARPFTAVNMASLSGSLFAAEFFGHAKGAFTGAERDRAGYLEATDGGTLFLDEIGNLPLAHQGMLLRALQDGEYTRLGSSRQQNADVRFIAATNEDLDKLMADGRFRKDLYYRIRGGWLHLPPLRERRDDISLLIEMFLREYAGRSMADSFAPEALELLLDYHYPGNVRELKAVIHSAVNLSRGAEISVALLPDTLRRQRPRVRRTEAPAGNAPVCLAEVERRHILNVYRQTGENKSRAARLLGIGLNTLRRRLKAYGIE